MTQQYCHCLGFLHPQYNGKLQFLTENTLIIEYNNPVLGIKEITYLEKNKQRQKTIEIKVNDFVDMDTYIFIKADDLYQSFTPESAISTKPTILSGGPSR